jgi:hypothetical protein
MEQGRNHVNPKGDTLVFVSNLTNRLLMRHAFLKPQCCTVNMLAEICMQQVCEEKWLIDKT